MPVAALNNRESYFQQQGDIHYRVKDNINSNQDINVTTDDITGICCENVACAIINEAYNLKEFIEKVQSTNNNKAFNLLDILHLNKVPDLLHIEDNVETQDPTINSLMTTLTRHLAGFNLQIDKVKGDGDCAFRSIGRQIKKKSASLRNKELTEHLISSGLLKDETQDAHTLRTLFADQLEHPGPDISNFLVSADDEMRKRARELPNSWGI